MGAGDEATVDREIGISADQIIEMVSAQFEGLRADEVTIRMYADKEALRYYQAAYRLDKMVETGLMRKRKLLHDGKIRWAFSWTESNGRDGDDG